VQFVSMAGQGAGAIGLAVANWQLLGAVAIVLIAFTILPVFLRAGVYTMPEFWNTGTMPPRAPSWPG